MEQHAKTQREATAADVMSDILGVTVLVSTTYIEGLRNVTPGFFSREKHLVGFFGDFSFFFCIEGGGGNLFS